MAVKITTVEEAVDDNGLKILVHALAGAGKTVLCTTSDEPTLILNVEGGLLSIKDAPEYIHTAKIKRLEEFDEIYQMLLDDYNKGEQQYRWVALDSISDIAETVLKNELDACPDPRKAYPAFQSKLTALIKNFRDLPGYHIVMTAKQHMFKDDYTGITLRSPEMPGNKLGPAVPYLYDEVFALRVEQDDDGEFYRVIQTGRDVMYEAKDRSGKLDMYEPPNLKHIHDKIYGVSTSETFDMPTAHTEQVEEQVAEADFTDEEIQDEVAQGGVFSDEVGNAENMGE